MKNKVALITGAGGGIGRAAALKLAESGMKLILFGGNNLEKLEETCKLVSQYTQCHIIPGNLTNLDFIARKVHLKWTAIHLFTSIFQKKEI